MTIETLSPTSLRDLHLGIWRAMMDDDARPAGQKQYLVRQEPDWREHGDRMETELARRGMWFPSLPWCLLRPRSARAHPPEEQRRRFIEAAQEAGASADEAEFDRALGKLMNR